MKRVLPVVFLAFALCASAWGQQAPPAPKITATTELVLIPALVTGKDGHIPNLTKNDFTVLENGREQKIAVFEEVRTGTERLARPQLGSGEFANLDVSQARRVSIIALDMINTPALALANLRDELVTFLSDAVVDDEPVGLVALLPEGIRVLHDVTTDKKVLALALQLYKAPPGKSTSRDTTVFDAQPVDPANASSEEEAASLARQLQAWSQMKDSEQRMAQALRRSTRLTTLEALQQLAQMLAGIPGRKTVIWASGSFPFGEIFTTTGGLSVDYTPTGKNTEALDYVAYTWRLLNEANIAIYPVDARGLVNTAYDVMTPDRKYSPTFAEKEEARNLFSESITTFENMASATGGKPCYGRTDLHNCFKEAIQESRSYYLLGYYVDRSKNPAPGWRKLEVRAAPKGAKVRARSGFFLAPANQNPVAARQADIGSALLAPVSYSGLSFRGKWLETAEKAGKKAVRFELAIPPNAINVDQGDGNHISLEVVAVASDKDGKAAAKLSQTIDRKLPPEAVPQIQSGGIRYRNVFEVTPGTYLVHFVVRDNLAGRTGSIVVPLQVK